MMTVNELMTAIGRTAVVRFESIQVEVTIEDVKVSYGRPRLLVRPIAGFDTQWIELNRVTAVVDTLGNWDGSLDSILGGGLQ